MQMTPMQGFDYRGRTIVQFVPSGLCFVLAPPVIGDTSGHRMCVHEATNVLAAMWWIDHEVRREASHVRPA